MQGLAFLSLGRRAPSSAGKCILGAACLLDRQVPDVIAALTLETALGTSLGGLRGQVAACLSPSSPLCVMWLLAGRGT